MANKQFRQISEMTPEEKLEFFDSFDTVFCDCDGVISHMLSGAIAGAADAIAKLQELGKKVVFVTNNSLCSSAEHLLKLTNCSIKISEEDIVHPAQSICSYLKQINFDGLIYCIASSTFKNVLHESGFQLVEEDTHYIKKLSQLKESIFCEDKVSAVIIDVDFNLTAVKIMKAQYLLQDSKCLFIAGAADKLINFGQQELLGPGLFIELLEKATKRHAQVFGKPGICLSEILKGKLNSKDLNRVLFIGDSLSSDIKFGKMCGFKTMLVLSGGTKYESLTNNLAESDMPDYVANSLADLLT